MFSKTLSAAAFLSVISLASVAHADCSKSSGSQGLLGGVVQRENCLSDKTQKLQNKMTAKQSALEKTRDSYMNAPADAEQKLSSKLSSAKENAENKLASKVASSQSGLTSGAEKLESARENTVGQVNNVKNGLQQDKTQLKSLGSQTRSAAGGLLGNSGL